MAFARRNFERAQSLHEQKLLAASALDDATSALEWRRTGSVPRRDSWW